MKNRSLSFLSLSLFFFLSTPGFSQDILWEKSYGGKHADYLMDAQPTADYGFILAGSSLSKKTGNKIQSNNGDLDYLIWKMNEGGELDWQKSFGGAGRDLLQSIAITNDGGFILAGTSSSNKGFDKKDNSHGQDDFWIIKLNPKGDEEWQATIGGESQEKIYNVKQTRDGGFILGGSSSSDKSVVSMSDVLDTKIGGGKTSDSFGNLDYWVVKLDRKGKIEWQKSFGGIYVDELRSIDTTSDGGYILGGYSNSPASGNKTYDSKGAGDYWIIKLDSTGVIQWQKNFGGNQDDQLYVVHQTYDNGYILGGNSNSESSESKSKSNGDGTDFWVIKLDDKGIILWQETYNYGEYDILTSLVENEDHTLLLGGFAKGEINTNRKSGKVKAKKGTDDYIALKISEKGEELWSESVGSDGEDVLRKVIETRDGGYVFAGTSNPQAFPAGKATQNSKGLGKGMPDSNNQNQTVEDTKNDINKEISNTSNEVNKKIKDNATTATNKVNDGLGLDKDSPLKLGVNDSASPLNLSKIGDGKAGSNPLSGSNSSSVLPASGDKKKSFGRNDFWVVKLKDKNKPKKDKPSIDAYPNPSVGYTNVIVGYDFETGTATVVDMAGRVLQTFEITSRTVPVDLSGYPEGIYVINIKTNVQSDGVKVIKGITKN
jgi:hypothetical protein